MICNVVLLRSHGNWRSRAQGEWRTGWPRLADFRRANPEHYGPSWQARLLSPRKLDTDLLPVLQYARILTIKDGGVLIHGTEISFRGVKSKPIHTQQTWWCVVHQAEGYAALERMNPKCTTGFSVNDDDDAGMRVLPR